MLWLMALINEIISYLSEQLSLSVDIFQGLCLVFQRDNISERSSFFPPSNDPGPRLVGLPYRLEHQVVHSRSNEIKLAGIC